LTGQQSIDPHLLIGGSNTASVPANAVAVLTAAVDWLTCTARQGANSGLLAAVGWAAVYAEAEAGNDLRPWLWKGYDGYMSGSAAVGERSDGTICRFSGDRAAHSFCGAVRHADRISRLDLAVTVRMDEDANPARDAYTLAREAIPNARGRRIQKASHIETWNEGETAYLGSRQSARFGRLYNKGLESKEERYRGCWRWEVEYKGDTASAIAGEMAQHGDTSEAPLAYVWDTFATWGIPPIWGRGAFVPLAALGRTATDDDRRLAWLAVQVAPVIARLLRAGKRQQVFDALGLTDPPKAE